MELSGKLRTARDDKLGDLNRAPRTDRILKRRWLRWARHVARMESKVSKVVPVLN
jgi:hypothetical protein